MRDDFQDIALRAAINVLRDSTECGRMPSGETLAAEASALHERAAAHLSGQLQSASGQGEPGRVRVSIELDDEEAWQLAQFFKRAGLSDYRANAESEANAYTMLHAGEKLRQALASQGIAPR